MSAERKWIDEAQQRPAIEQPVTIMVMRRAKLVNDADGGVKWQFLNQEEPIDLQQDVIYWLPDEK